MDTEDQQRLTSIRSITLEVDDPDAAARFYDEAFELGDRLRLRRSDAPTSGFRGFTMSLIVAQPADVLHLFDAAVAAGATVLKPAEKSLWGFGGIVQAPDGTIWQMASESKKDTGPATHRIENVVLLLGADDVSASKRIYADRGLTVAKSIGGYVDFAMGDSPIGLGLYKRRSLAKTVGVAADGTGSHRVEINGDAAAFVDPDGFAWAPAPE
ncbi:glyoxalase [Agromyces endophyticus]|uniref:glyoxalase n=1 Tax=Agromyces sp. H17E-10 TaxID=2932244 RepID=UPI001FCFF4E9|nr:glyoxalase [Agromyces sp. H17E-10]UOQ90140.1 glyoxalase [Agromyces sp. H17E-10]